MWRQRSRVIWLNALEHKVFPSDGFDKAKEKCYYDIFNEHGRWVTKEEDIRAVAKAYFEDIFKSSNFSHISHVLEAVHRRVTDDMNERLIRPFDRSEVLSSLQQMYPSKAPGPDGLPTLFYQRFWDIVGDGITDAVLPVLNGSNILPDWNRTKIVLIPKIKSLKYITDFRPISLCNVQISF